MLKQWLKKTKALPFSRTRDTFQKTSRLWIQHFYEHRTPLVIAFALFLIGGGGLSFYQYYQGQTEMKAQSQLYQTVAKWNALTVSSDDPQAVATQPGILMQKDYEELAYGYQRVMDEYKGSKGAVLAALHLSHLQITQGRLKEALESMQQVEPVLNTEGLIDGMAQMVLAHLYESNQQCEKAVRIWDQVIDASHLSFFHAEALLKQGLCFEGTQQTDKAFKNYQKLVDDHTQSPSGQLAQRLLQLSSKQTDL